MRPLILKMMADRLTPIVLWWLYIGIVARHTTWLDSGSAIDHIFVAVVLALAAAGTDLLISIALFNRGLRKEQERARNENANNRQRNTKEDF